LVDVDGVSGSWNNDTYYGNANANVFYTGGGQTVVDGRAGYDTVWLPDLRGNGATSLADFSITVSIDGQSLVATTTLRPQFKLTASNVEALGVGGRWQDTYVLSTLVKPEDMAIQGLVAGAANRWNAAAPLGSAAEVSFSFVASAPTSGVGATGFRVFTAAEQDAVRTILASVAAATGLTFKEVGDTAAVHGDMRFGASQQAATKGATFLPGTNGDAGGDVWMDVDSLVNLTVGSAGYAALLHEIGHALGLRHPTNVDPTDNFATQVSAAYDATAYSVMSGKASADGLFPSTWSSFDITALRYLYGTKAINSGDTTYVLGGTRFTSQTSIIDDGGTNTIDASGARTGASIDLVAGHLSSVGVTAAGVAAVGNLSLGTSTLIQNAIGSDYDDVILGNDLNNMVSSGRGNDWIDGGKGLDTAVFSGARSSYLISSGFGKTFVAARDGTSGFDTLLNVETLKFADQSINLGSSAFGADQAINVDQASSVTGSLPDPTDTTRAQVTYSVASQPAHGTLTLDASGAYTYTPQRDFSSADSFTYTLKDKGSGSNVYTAFIQVRPVELTQQPSDANTTLAGGSGNDVLTTGAGNDLITGGAGNDTIDGGGGSNTAVYAGALSGYTLTRSGSSTIVSDKSGADGIDSVTNIGTLKFKDLTVNLAVQGTVAAAPSADVHRVIELYVAFFNRVPDADGLAYWVGQRVNGVAINAIGDIFYGAGVQFSTLTGFTATMSNADFVNLIYKNVLGRKDGADASGLAYWSGELTSGRATHGSLVAAILDSAHTFKGNPTLGYVADLLDNKIAVATTLAVNWGLGYADPNAALSNGMAIAAAITPTDMTAALKLIGISAADIHLG
jgi:Ca2+-binding RTX toxin-like protein